jgi:hypothetical protein
MKTKSESNLDYAGMAGTGVNRQSGNQYCHNPMPGFANPDMINAGRGPVKGNASSSPDRIGPPATRDRLKMTIATAAQGGRINGGANCKTWPNPDKINVG